MANSLDHAFFYKSVNGDRVYDDASFEHWLKKFFTSGVFLNDLQVTANDNMIVTVGTGYANADGKVKIFENATALQLETAGSTYPRIDSVVVERNDADRDIILKVITGGYSSEPVAHIPVRRDGVYQLVIAQIYVAAGAVKITQANITDTRSDADLCGFVAGAVDQIDFSQIQAQFDAYFAEYKERIATDYAEYNEDMETYLNQMETDFETWFDGVKGQLSGDAAANLQLQIDELKSTEGMELTQAEYDALSESKKRSGTYYITDSDDGVTVGEVHQEVTEAKKDIVALSNALEEAGTARYNPLTDMIELKRNGEWVPWKWAGLTFNGVIYGDGTFASGYNIDTTPTTFSEGWNVVGGFIDDGNAIKAAPPSGTQNVVASMLKGAVDFSKYNYIKAIVNGKTYTIDVSAYSGIGYIGFVISGNTGYPFYRLYVCTEQTPPSFDDYSAIPFTTFTSQAGYNNITRLWVE